MSERDYLVAKALRDRVTNENLTNAQLNRRMKNSEASMKTLGSAGAVVPGARDVAGSWAAERKFRVGRNARKGEAREIQQRSQKASAGGSVATIGTLTAGMSLPAAGRKAVDRARTAPKGKRRARAVADLRSIPRRVAKMPPRAKVGLSAAGAGGVYAAYQGNRRAKVEQKVWDRRLKDAPNRRD